MRSKLIFSFACVVVSAFAVRADVESGPKEGEKATEFKAFSVNGDPKAQDVNFVEQRKDKPTVYVFVSAKGFDRPMFRYIKKLGDDLPEGTQIISIWLTEDTDKSKELLEKLVKADYFAKNTLAVLGEVAGPKNWGINSDAKLTAVVVNKGKVVKSFAYDSINETDAEKVVKSVKDATK